ncbi:MAG: OmpA family protein [Pseudomonadota bacterium]
MRVVLGLIALGGFAAICWLAVLKGSEHPYLQGAPQIAARVQAETTAAVREAGGTALDIVVDGRKVHLSGGLASRQELEAVTSAVRDIPIVGRFTQDIIIAEADAPSEDSLASFAVAVTETPPEAQALATEPGVPAPIEAVTDPETGLFIDPTVPPGVYYMRARKTIDGTILLTGKVHDASTRRALIRAAEALTNVPLIEKLVAADDFPSQVWLNANLQGLEALAWMHAGDLSTTGPEVSLRGTVETPEDEELLMGLAQPDWVLQVTVENTEPRAEVTLVMAEDGSITGRGMLPEGVSAEAFAEMLPGLTADDFMVQGTGEPVDWSLPLEGLGIVLPRLENAEMRLTDTQVFLSGTLKDGYSVDGLEATLRTAITEGWILNISVEAPPPQSELILTKADGVIGLGGVVPRGLTPDEVLALFGDDAGGTGLTEGGAGDAGQWRDGLTGAAEMLGLFTQATGAISDDRIALTGTLKPGYDVETVRDWQSARTGANWTIEIEAEETPAADGDKRAVLSDTDSGFGAEERFANGFWLPVLDFTPSVEACTAETEAELETAQVSFITKSARFAPEGREVLDRLGAVFARCTEVEAMRLEIGAHTDSVGNDATNLKLSESQAKVVMEEMIKRGVPAAAMTAVGHGEDDPIATNNTSEGRARNRRITFSWSTADR